MGKVKLQLLTTTDDTKDNTVTFTSADESNPTAWKDVAALASKEKHSSLLNKISTMFSNVRYLYKILGTTDISALGTVTQAIATLNGNVGSIKGISSSKAITTQGEYALDAREKNASVEGTLANELSKVNSNFNKKHTTLLNTISSGQWTKVTTGNIKIDSNHTYLVITTLSIVCPSDTNGHIATIRSNYNSNHRQSVTFRSNLVISATLSEIVANIDDEDYGVAVYPSIDFNRCDVDQTIIQLK